MIVFFSVITIFSLFFLIHIITSIINKNQEKHCFSYYPSAIISSMRLDEFQESLMTANLSLINQTIISLEERKDYLNKIVEEAEKQKYSDETESESLSNKDDKKNYLLRTEIKQINKRLIMLNNRKLELEK